MNRKICVVSGSRAEYGLLKPILTSVVSDETLTLQFIVTGMHLSPTFGSTFQEIESDGFKIDRKIDCIVESDSSLSISEAIGKTIKGCAKALHELRPDIVLVVGDRFEIFAAASASYIARIPIAHIHGGEVTLGSFDEAFRHSITKMSSVHFVATEEYRNRVIQLGENPDSVYRVGGLGVDAMQKVQLLNRKEIERKLKLEFRAKNLLVTVHPETIESNHVDTQVRELLHALSALSDTTLIFTMPNADPGGLRIMELLVSFVNKHPNSYIFESLGQQLFLSCLAQVDAIVGNSSSGILEAPSLKIATVNIGNRQEGRVQSESIVNCAFDSAEISDAIKRIYEPDFQSILEKSSNPYGDGGASDKIIRVLKNFDLKAGNRKKFYDL